MPKSGILQVYVANRHFVGLIESNTLQDVSALERKFLSLLDYKLHVPWQRIFSKRIITTFFTMYIVKTTTVSAFCAVKMRYALHSHIAISLLEIYMALVLNFPGCAATISEFEYVVFDSNFRSALGDAFLPCSRKTRWKPDRWVRPNMLDSILPYARCRHYDLIARTRAWGILRILMRICTCISAVCNLHILDGTANSIFSILYWVIEHLSLLLIT